jgi:hypothetical protein
MSGLPAGGGRPLAGERSVSLRLEGFAWEAIEQESARLGVPTDELVAFAVMYYLADVDGGRIARRISRSPYPDASAGDSAPGDASP